MLVLFDIDATLIRTSGAGIRAMVSAGRRLFGRGFTAEGLDFAGRLDPLILRDMLALSGVPATAANLDAIRATYRVELERELAASPGSRVRLPGVAELLDALARTPGVTLGLLTGNFAETGCLKLSACGIDPGRFPVCVWGDDSPHDPPARDHLPPVAMDRYRARFGRVIDPASVTIIGDTPHDVGCAIAHGCRSLGVGTGHYSPGELADAGAHLALPDLSGTGVVVRWLLDGTAPTTTVERPEAQEPTRHVRELPGAVLGLLREPEAGAEA